MNPENLKDITPPSLGFTVLSKFHGPVMYAGQIVEQAPVSITH